MLDLIQRAHFRYFVVNQDPETNHDRKTGLIKDRSTSYSPASVAACGFALTSYCVAAERGWVTRQEAALYCHRVLTTLANVRFGTQLEGMGGYRGFFYHFLDPRLATRACDLKFWPQLLPWFKDRPPPRIDVEVSAIDTALLVAGALFARNYFNQATPLEISIFNLATRIYERVEWDWLLSSENLLHMGWKPESGILPARFQGFSEAHLLYILALGSPTHAIPRESWAAYLKGAGVETLYGQTFVKMPDFPMYGYQYPACWIDFRGITCALGRALGFDWFTNSVRATRAQYRYAEDNPLEFRGYGPGAWGLTASDGPGDFTVVRDGRQFIFHSYGVRGPDGPDDGTIAPTALAASLPFAPDLVLPTLRLWMKERPELFTDTGFTDAFNETADLSRPSGWVDPDQLGIDQGPIVAMIENYRSELVWEYMMRDGDLLLGLSRAGFEGGIGRADRHTSIR
jgi:hypothetical protein